MSIKYYANKVQETSLTTGQGNLVLSGSPIGYKNFVSTIGPNNKFTYYIYRLDSNLEWEIGVGYILSSGGINQLVRETVISSTNLDTYVGFTAGTKHIEPILGEDRVNASFANIETKSASFTAPYISATYLIDASSGNVQVSLPQVSTENDPIILGFLLKNTIGNQYQQSNAISILPSGLETINGDASAEIDIIQDYLQLVSIPSQTGWLKLDPIQDSTYPYGNDGTIQIKYDSAFSGVSSLSWNISNNSFLVGGTGSLSSANIILPASGQTTVFNEQSLDQDFRIEGSGNTHLLFLDAGANKIGINTSNPYDSLTINSQNANGITIYRSGVGPKVVLSNTSNSGLATNGTVGSVVFSGLNNNNNSVEYGVIYTTIDSAIDSSESSSLSVQIMNNGYNEDVAVFSASGVNLGFNNQNIDGIIVGSASSNEGNNIALGYYNNICGENCVVIGTNISGSGNFGGAIGNNHAVSGTNIWLIGGSGILTSGNNKTYLGLNNNNHLVISNSGRLDYTTLSQDNINFNINNKSVLSSGIKESINFNFINSNSVEKTGLKLGSNIISYFNNSESVDLYAQSLYNGASVDILTVGGNRINIGKNTYNNLNNNILCGLNNNCSGEFNVINGRNLQNISGDYNTLFGTSSYCFGNFNTVAGYANTSRSDSTAVFGNLNETSGIYSTSIIL